MDSNDLFSKKILFQLTLSWVAYSQGLVHSALAQKEAQNIVIYIIFSLAL